jgi:hypothetical protein
VDEAPHEWTAETHPSAPELAAAPRRWRLALNRQRERQTNVMVSTRVMLRHPIFFSLNALLISQTTIARTGAFCDWRVVLAISENLVPAFSRLLVAGGAHVLCDR